MAAGPGVAWTCIKSACPTASACPAMQLTALATIVMPQSSTSFMPAAAQPHSELRPLHGMSPYARLLHCPPCASCFWCGSGCAYGLASALSAPW